MLEGAMPETWTSFIRVKVDDRPALGRLETVRRGFLRVTRSCGGHEAMRADAVRRIARAEVEPDAEEIQNGLLAAQRYRTTFQTYHYIDPEGAPR